MEKDLKREKLGFLQERLGVSRSIARSNDEELEDDLHDETVCAIMSAPAAPYPPPDGEECDPYDFEGDEFVAVKKEDE